MHLTSLLDARDICCENRVLSKQQVYSKLVEIICRNHSLPICGNRLLDMILKRDDESLTAYPTGIAIPHIRMDGFEDTVVAMALLQNPLDYEGTKVSLVVLVITDKSSSKLYLNLVAALLKLSKDDSAMAALASARDGAGVFHLLKEMQIKIKQDLTIADIMITNPCSVRPGQKLSELGNLMSEKGISVLPVTDTDNNYLGEVSILAFLKVGVPDYLMMLDNLNFLQTFEPMENLFEKQDTVCVKEIMNKDVKTLKPDASIIEAVFEMIHNKKRHLSVVENGKLVGIVTAMDIFKKVVRA